VAHTRLIAETLGAVALGEFFDRLWAEDSEFLRWLDEVSQPPSGVEVRSPRMFTGLLWVLGNRIKRAIVIEHRVDVGKQTERTEEALSPLVRPRRQHRRDLRPRARELEDDEFPTFG
jgi:hypothetical protein